MHLLIQFKKPSPLFVRALVLVCFAFTRSALAVVPPPDGGYPGFNTAEGQNTLFGLTTGSANTAVGWFSLFSNAVGSFNTGTGAGTLVFNTGDENTALGTAALLFNTTGLANTGVGTVALSSNTEGEFNTATGDSALFTNTTGANNTAAGVGALFSNTTGGFNTATGLNALVTNTTGNNNVALGALAGSSQTTGNNNIYIGGNIPGVAGESDACYIASIFGQTSADGIAVLINSSNKLGTTTSSERFKKDIATMNKTSEAVLSLRPVTFHYKTDTKGTPQFGLIAEDVEKVNPDLVVRDKEGKPYTVRYDAVNAMLLNEFLKEHQKVQKLEATVVQQQENFQTKLAEQQKQIDALTAGLQRVSAQLELSKPAPQTVLNNQ
jgi:hypothetical protein